MPSNNRVSVSKYIYILLLLFLIGTPILEQLLFQVHIIHNSYFG